MFQLNTKITKKLVNIDPNETRLLEYTMKTTIRLKLALVYKSEYYYLHFFISLCEGLIYFLFFLVSTML